MSKRILMLVSILFLSSILVLSCSNASKTGSVDNNSGNGGSSTGDGGTGTGGDGGTGTGGTGGGGTGDGGTTPTPQPDGIAKYAGTWTAKFNTDNNSYDITIGSDGNVTIKDPSGKQIKAENIEGSGNTYTMKVQHSSVIEASTVAITFTNETSGTINDTSDAFGDGVIRKQNGGNKGLWYYEGTWTLIFSQKLAQAAQNPTITISNDGTVTFGDDKSTNVADKGNETYEVKFTPANEGESILTLTFRSDTEGTFTLSISDNPEGSGSGTMTKQQ